LIDDWVRSRVEFARFRAEATIMLARTVSCRPGFMAGRCSPLHAVATVLRVDDRLGEVWEGRAAEWAAWARTPGHDEPHPDAAAVEEQPRLAGAAQPLFLHMRCRRE
jgi:hypothetical protein